MDSERKGGCKRRRKRLRSSEGDGNEGERRAAEAEVDLLSGPMKVKLVMPPPKVKKTLMGDFALRGEALIETSLTAAAKEQYTKSMATTFGWANSSVSKTEGEAKV
ncbi:MAG: hypothetical protein ACTS6A_01355 [Candidatus Hodgkinia cicadicola]